MVILRASVRRTSQLISQSLCATHHGLRTRSWQQIQRRDYASSGGEDNSYRGDIPW